MKVKQYAVLEMAIEQGVNYGVRRAFKYTESPTHEHLAEVVHQAVMSSLSEWFVLEGEAPEPERPQRRPVRVSGVPYAVDLSDGGHHD